MKSEDVQGPQPIQEGWFDSLFPLLDKIFRPDGKRSMRSDFPFYLRRENAANLFVCVAENRVVCHLGYLPVTLSFFGHPVETGMVGAVATDPEWRGGGLATRTLLHLFDEARRRGVCMLMISGGRGLYLRNGALATGNFAEYSLSPVRIPAADVEIVKAGPEDAAVLSALYMSKPYRFIRPLDMWRRLLSARICHNYPTDYFIVKKNGRPMAYFTLVSELPGDDGICHAYEYGGVMQEVIAGMGKAAAIRSDISQIVLSSYLHETGVNRALENAGADSPVYRPMHGTSRIIDFERLMSSLLPYIEEIAGSDIASGLKFAENAEGIFTLGYKAESVRIQGHAELADVLFHGGPESLGDALAGKKELGTVLEAFLPFTAPKYDMSYA